MRDAGRPLHQRAARPDHGNSSTATQAVVVFVLIELSLVIIPFGFLEFRPEGTKVQLKRAQDWLTSHARQLLAGVAVFAGLYVAIGGLVRLLLPATPLNQCRRGPAVGG
jgi:Sap-like sulfolipid-1-addressing protein